MFRFSRGEGQSGWQVEGVGMLRNNTGQGVGEKVKSGVTNWQNVPWTKIKVIRHRRGAWRGRKGVC